MAFLNFLEHLLIEQYPTERIVLVLDNASIHKSQISQAALSLFEHRLLIFWLPPYCSTLNMIERFWRHLKDKVCVNKLFPNMTDLLTSVQACLHAQNDL